MVSSILVTLALSLFIVTGGLLVLLRNTRNVINIQFFFLCIVAASWGAIFRLIEVPADIDIVNLLNKVSYAAALVLLYAVLRFTYIFPKKRENKYLKYYSILILIFMALCFTEFTYGAGTAVYISFVAIGLSIVGRSLYAAYKEAETEIHKSQVKSLFFGFMLSFVVGLMLAAIIPIIQPESTVDDYAPFALLFFVYFAGKAIIQHRLFDFRVVLARTVGYLFTTIFVVVSYVGLAFIIRVFVFDIKVQTTQLVSSAVLTTLLVLFYPRVKSLFDKVSSKIFYRDSYDAQVLLDELNRTLVADVEIKSLLEKTATIIETNLKASYCGFYIRETAYFPSRFVANYKRKIPSDHLEKIRQLTPLIRYKIHSVDVEPDNNEEKILNEILKKNDIEVLGRLVSTLKYEVAGVGYLLLGSKLSGEVYSEQDLKVLEIITNELILAVENALRLEEIEQFNVTLRKKIDGATKELKDSNEKLKALDEAKDEFVSMASHQLRTPLTSIKGYISMVLEEDAGKINDVQKQMLGQAFFSSQRMVYLISDLLNVSRLQTGKFLIEPKPVYLPDMVESELQQLQEGATAKNQTLTFTKPKDFPTLNLDDMKTRQVMMNFIDNALYYTPTGGKISIELKDKNKSIEFIVKDSGIGVPKAEQHKLFAKFFRAENARKARPDGTGLGLFMAKKVIVAQGGAIIFESKEDKGSTFGFSFPKDKLEIETPKD
jgi:signal transduction histidine kinase